MDRSLVLAAREGDEDAFAAIVRGSADGLMAVAYRILRDIPRAEDAVQAAFVAAWRDLPGLRDPERFDAWLHRLLVNACYSESRRRSRWMRFAGPETESVPDAAQETLTVELRDQLERAFDRLSAEQRSIFVMHHYAGFGLAEIADSLGVPLGTVKSRLHYAAQALRSAIAADERTPMVRERTA